jgi:rhodanese-related sulfurtransferase
LERWLAAGEAVVVDVRQEGAFAAEHIAGAHSIPFTRFDPAALPPLAGRRLVLQCQMGILSERAGERAADAGILAVVHLGGGLQAWKRAGLATRGGGRAPLGLERQVQIGAGALVLAGTALAVLSPWWLLVPGAVGVGLLCAGATGWCGMTLLLLRLPRNRTGGERDRA